MVVDKNDNPYSGRVVGFVSREGVPILEQREDIDNMRLLINLGSQDGIELDERFLVFALGTEIVDPETRRSLGYFEETRGFGKVEYVQEKMCTIKSDRRVPIPAVTNALLSLSEQSTGVRRNKAGIGYQLAPFRSPQIGDYVRLV